MRLALVQQQPSASRPKSIERGIAALREAAEAGADLVAYPELSFSPFWPQNPATGDVRELAEPIPGPTTDAFQEAAARHGVVVLPNLYERDGDNCYDTSPVIDADGSLLGRTRMVHITDYEGFHEQGYYAPGNLGAPVYDTAAGRIGMCICYDRHFPEYLRALALEGAELVVVPQAGIKGEWPEGLFEAEMQVAAFQHGFFTALVNRVGPEKRLTFAGGSFVTSPTGQLIGQAAFGEETIFYADIDLAQVQEAPARKLFLRHRRPDAYREGSVRSEPTGQYKATRH